MRIRKLSALMARPFTNPPPEHRDPPSTLRVAVLTSNLCTRSDGALPSSFRVLPFGEFAAKDGRPTDIPGGVWRLTEESARRIVAELSALADDGLIDWEHGTLHAKATGAYAPAAGWFSGIEFRPGEGLFLTGVRWTEKAAAALRAGEYRYVSPIFSYDQETGEVLSLINVALTNDAGLPGLTDLSVALTATLTGPHGRAMHGNPSFSQERTMPLAILPALFGLSLAATEEQVAEQVRALQAQSVALTAQLADAKDPAKVVPIAALTAVQRELAASKQELAALQAKQHDQEVEQLVRQGLADGKLVPALEQWALDTGKASLAALQGYLAAAAPVIVPGTKQSAEAKAGTGTAALSAVESSVAAALGLSQEQYQSV